MDFRKNDIFKFWINDQYVGQATGGFPAQGQVGVRMDDAVHELHVPLLDVAAVEEHDGAEVPGGGGAVDITGEAVLDQAGDVTRMVYMGMGEYQDIHR